jgi:hypothetical protein
VLWMQWMEWMDAVDAVGWDHACLRCAVSGRAGVRACGVELACAWHGGRAEAAEAGYSWLAMASWVGWVGWVRWVGRVGCQLPAARAPGSAKRQAGHSCALCP